MPTKENSGSKDGRARAWTFLVYPFESAPENWRDILDNEHIPWIESPVHSPDKKSLDSNEHDYRHHHIELLYDGKKSFEQVSEVTKKLNGTRPFVVNDIRAMTRYFAHLDQPEKEPFSASDIIAHNGADIKDYLINKSDKYFYLSEMMGFIKDNTITEYHDFMDYCREFRFDTWFQCLCDNGSFVIINYIKSYRHDPKREQLQLDDGIEGECTEVK